MGIETKIQLVSDLVQYTEPDMNRFAYSEALDYIEAYYKVRALFLSYPYFYYLPC